MHYVQVNITLSPEQVEFVKANHGKMNIGKLSKMLGLTYNKVHNNMKLMGLCTQRKSTQAKVVKMEGYFDMDEFAKQYNY